MEQDSFVKVEAQSLVQTEVRNTIGVITLNDSHRANCLSPDLINEVLAALADFERKTLRVVVLSTPAPSGCGNSGLTDHQFISLFLIPHFT